MFLLWFTPSLCIACPQVKALAKHVCRGSYHTGRKTKRQGWQQVRHQPQKHLQSDNRHCGARGDNHWSTNKPVHAIEFPKSHPKASSLGFFGPFYGHHVRGYFMEECCCLRHSPAIFFTCPTSRGSPMQLAKVDAPQVRSSNALSW